MLLKIGGNVKWVSHSLVPDVTQSYLASHRSKLFAYGTSVVIGMLRFKPMVRTGLEKPLNLMFVLKNP